MSDNQLTAILQGNRQVSVREYKNSTSTTYTTGASKLVTWARERGLNPQDASVRAEHSKFCNKENAKLQMALSYLTQDGFVLDRMVDKVDRDGIHQAFTIKMVRPSVPKIKAKADKINDLFSGLSDADKAEVLALAKAKAKANQVIEA